jgi:hypothetical protein
VTESLVIGTIVFVVLVLLVRRVSGL